MRGMLLYGNLHQPCLQQDSHGLCLPSSQFKIIFLLSGSEQEASFASNNFRTFHNICGNGTKWNHGCSAPHWFLSCLSVVIWILVQLFLHCQPDCVVNVLAWNSVIYGLSVCLPGINSQSYVPLRGLILICLDVESHLAIYCQVSEYSSTWRTHFVVRWVFWLCIYSPLIINLD